MATTRTRARSREKFTYGRPLDPARSGDPPDEQRFAYPLYVIFFLAPFVHLPFEVVEYVFIVLLAVLCAWSVLLWANAMGLRWVASTKMAVVLLVFSTLEAMQGLARLQLSLLVFAFLTFGVWLIVRRCLSLGGLAFAVATIKPQLVLLPLVFLVFWASACRTRRAFLFGFTLGMALLLAAAELVQPGWILAFLEAVLAYHRYAAGSLLNFILPPIVAWIPTFALVALAFALFWKVRKAEADSPEFQVVLAVAMSITTSRGSHWRRLQSFSAGARSRWISSEPSAISSRQIHRGAGFPVTLDCVGAPVGLGAGGDYRGRHAPKRRNHAPLLICVCAAVLRYSCNIHDGSQIGLRRTRSDMTGFALPVLLSPPENTAF
jgi:hypothetical protein